MIKEYFCKDFNLRKDFLELNELDYFIIYLRFMREVYGDSLDEEKLKEQFLNILQDLSLKINKKGLKINKED